jgi:hypothetical protein
MVDGSVGLAGAAFGEEVAAPVAGALVRGHGDACLAGGGALGQEVVAGVDPRPAGALVAARLLRSCSRYGDSGYLHSEQISSSSHPHIHTRRLNYIYQQRPIYG